MRPNGDLSLRPATFLISAILILILILTTQEKADGASTSSVKGAKSADHSIFERPDHGFSPNDDAKAEVGTHQDRKKRLIPPNEKNKIVSMLFTDKDGRKENISDLTTNDIIIRLQEKYENTICQSYLKSVPDLKNKYFQYDTSLLPYQDLDTDPGPMFDRRYRLLQEPCNRFNELAFWREMFQVAEDDHSRILRPGVNVDDTQGPTPTPISEEDFIYIQHPMAATMERWHNLWLKYQSKSVCNQKLLLECIDPFTKKDKEVILENKTEPWLGVCECRTREVGIPSVFPTGNIYNVEGGHGRFQRIFVSLYYVNTVSLENGEAVTIPGNYTFHNRCVVQASISQFVVKKPMLITNPCDFSLPMIGMCAADCVFNSSCVTATPEEKEDMLERAGKDWLERIRDKKVHSVFHHKCQCEEDDDGKPKVCHLAGTDFFGEKSGEERSTIRPGSLILSTFSIIYYTCYAQFM